MIFPQACPCMLHGHGMMRGSDSFLACLGKKGTQREDVGILPGTAAHTRIRPAFHDQEIVQA